jgi:hypothetical protein
MHSRQNIRMAAFRLLPVIARSYKRWYFAGTSRGLIAHPPSVGFGGGSAARTSAMMPTRIASGSVNHVEFNCWRFGSIWQSSAELLGLLLGLVDGAS